MFVPTIQTYCAATFLLALNTTGALAHSYGPAPRVTGAPGDNSKACTSCHSGTALNGGSGSVTITLQSGPVYIPGIKQRVTVTVADPAQQRWGFELTARLNSSPDTGQAGELHSVDNFTQVICEDAGAVPCLSGVSFIQHTSAGTRLGSKNSATFQFDWTPPSSGAGPVTLYAAGNAANGDANLTGDHIYTTSVQLNAIAAIAPTIASGGVLSGATFTAGPVAPNSWLAIYGSNLSATTRSWQDSDFVNGAYPTSLDGVSVVLTAFGAPRRGYIGFVSPGQINVLLPSDTNATTVQVQVKNPAGLSSQVPVTVQATSPQLLTLDGKYVLAAHSDGSLVGKAGLNPSFSTSPAIPGETVTIYATGCGVTSPALISGQIPLQANSLVALPQALLGGNAAPVSAGAVTAGLGGVYQLKVQIPANAVNGDSPLALQLGTNTSATALLTIQR